MIELHKLKELKNENVLNRFLNQFSFSYDEATDIFEETKKWLWLCAKIQIDRKTQKMNLPQSLLLDEQTQVIDEMWHCFILFTKEYQEFCMKYLDVFIHHFPNTSKNTTIDMELLYENQYNYIYENLGADTLIKWYEEYPKKYSMVELSQKFKYNKDV